MKIQKLDEFIGKKSKNIDQAKKTTALSGNTINVNLGGNKLSADGASAGNSNVTAGNLGASLGVDASGVASGTQINPNVKADVGAQVNPQVSADGAAVGVGGATNPQAALPEDVRIDGSGQTMSKNVDKDSEEDSEETKEEEKVLNEGRLGELAFGNSLAMSLYEEFYSELQKAIDNGEKDKAINLYNDFEQDLGTLKRQNKRWHKTFIEIQEYLLNKYKMAIESLPDEDATQPQVKESVDDNFDYEHEEEVWDEYDDDYDDYDEVELDRQHAALYGGDRVYCDCGKRRVPDEFGYFYCPACDKYE